MRESLTTTLRPHEEGSTYPASPRGGDHPCPPPPRSLPGFTRAVPALTAGDPPWYPHSRRGIHPGHPTYSLGTTHPSLHTHSVGRHPCCPLVYDREQLQINSERDVGGRWTRIMNPHVTADFKLTPTRNSQI